MKTCLWAGALLLALAGPARAQTPEPLSPEQAREIAALLAPRPAPGRARPGYDPRLFGGDTLQLAQAILRQRGARIRQLLRQHPGWLQAREPTYGWTPLLFAAWNGRRRACAALLALGADPNVQSTDNGQTPLIEALDSYRRSARLVGLLLAHGADPNRAAVVGRNTRYETPLAVAVSTRRRRLIGQLLRAGADPHRPGRPGYSPLLQAVLTHDAAWVYYCVAELGLDFSQPLTYDIQGQPHYLVDWLRGWFFPLGSRDHQQKMKLVAYLKAHGQDYGQAPIHLPANHHLSPEYLERY